MITAFLTCVLFLAIGADFSLTEAPSHHEPATLEGAKPVELLGKELFGKDWILREDMPVFSEPTPESLQCGIYQKTDALRLAFRLSSMGGPNTSPVMVRLCFNPMYFFVAGTPVLMNPKTGEKKETDYIFENDRVIFAVSPSADLRYIEFYVASRKLGNLGKLSIEDKVKQARTIRRISQKIMSWSPLAPGQIIAQETLRPIVSHGGYAVNGTKQAVIWANDKTLTGTFELIDAQRNRQHPDVQAVVYTGKLTEIGRHIWGGKNYIADFSDFRKEGLYFVRLKVNETKEMADSFVFPIKKHLYLDLAKKAAGWFYYQRCGTEVPGFHKACHTQDAVIKNDGTRVDISGGWHDAGDYGKWIGGGTAGILALAMFQDEFGNELAVGLGIPEVVDEAAWEARYFCKAYWDGIFHEGFTPNLENVCEWLGAPEQEPPRVLTEVQSLRGLPRRLGLSLTGAALAKVARLIMPHDDALAKQCISIAKDVYEIDSGAVLKTERERRLFLRIQSGLLLSDLELFGITKDEKYKNDARKRVQIILKLQDEKEGFFYTDEARSSTRFEDCDVHLAALAEFLKRNPDSELDAGIRDAFRRWAEYTMQFSDLSSFGLIGGKGEDGLLRNYKYDHGGNRRIGAMAWGLATAAILLKESKYLEAAERQIQWIVGFNAADVSMMAGVGRGPGCYHHRYCFMEGCEDGNVPGGVLNGIVRGNGKIIEIGDITKNYVIAYLPVDYPVIDTDVWGWTYAYLTNEYWTRNNAGFLMGALQVEKALREFQKRE